MRNECTPSTEALNVSKAGNSPKMSGVKLDQLPFEIISIIIDYLVIATDSISPHTDLDTFIQGCSGSRKPILSRVYSKEFASLMAVNRLFHTLVTDKIYKSIILMLPEHASLSANSENGAYVQTECEPFVLSDSSVTKKSGRLVVTKYRYLVNALTTPMIKAMQHLCITGQDRWYYDSMIFYKGLTWPTISAAKNLRSLTIDTKLFSYIYNEHYTSPFLSNEEENYRCVYEKLLIIQKEGFEEYLTQDAGSAISKASTPNDLVAYKLQLLSNTLAKTVANQTHKMSCTLIHNYHRLPNFSSLVWAFDKEKVLDTIESLVIRHSIRGLSSFLFLSHLASLRKLKRFCFDSYMNFETSLFVTLEKLGCLEQLLLDTSFTTLPMETFRLPCRLQKLVITEKILFHNQLEFYPSSFDNLRELHLNFWSGYYNNPDVWHRNFLEKLNLKSLKTLVVKGETQDNMLLLSHIINLNPGITTFSLSIPSFHQYKINQVLASMKHIECFCVYFGLTMSDPSENIQSSPLISDIIARLSSLRVLVLDSGDLHLSLKQLLNDLTSVNYEKSRNLHTITIYHTDFSDGGAKSPGVMDCFNESSSKQKSIVSNVDLTTFMSIKNVVPPSEVKGSEFPMYKLNIDVGALKETKNDHSSLYTTRS
jgi:hypothetical protein